MARTICAAALALVASGCTTHQHTPAPTFGTLTGQIQISGGMDFGPQPFKAAHVTAISTRTIVATTDAMGIYTTRLRPGRYKLKISAPHYYWRGYMYHPYCDDVTITVKPNRLNHANLSCSLQNPMIY